MRQSNGYIIGFTTAITVVIGVILAITDMSLKSRIKENQLNERKSNILSSVTRIQKGVDIAELYDQSIVSTFVGEDGKEITDKSLWVQGDKPTTPEKFSVEKAYKDKKKAAKLNEEYNLLLPVYKYRNKADTSKFDAIVFPVYGGGLWDDIWGYIAIKGDFETIKGVVFDHKAETPGLGARITNNKKNTGNSNAFQERFKGKLLSKMINGEEKFIEVLKGESNNIKGETAPIQLNGLSGASMTTEGLNAMLADYANLYSNYLKMEKKEAKKNEGKGTKNVKKFHPNDYDTYEVH